MVADLLRGFVHEDWVKDLDFVTLERVGDGYVTDDLRERLDDIVWRVRLGPLCRRRTGPIAQLGGSAVPLGEQPHPAGRGTGIDRLGRMAKVTWTRLSATGVHRVAEAGVAARAHARSGL